MGNSVKCNCLENNIKDKQGGNLCLDDLNTEKGKIQYKTNDFNNNNSKNSNILKENLQNVKENKNVNINLIKKKSSSSSHEKNEVTQSNNFIIKNKMNEESFVNQKEKKDEDSTNIIICKDKENKNGKKIDNDNQEIQKKEDKKSEEKIKKKIEKSKFAKTIIICGPIESGKTSFSMRYCDNKFDNCYIPSLMNEISSKNVILNNGEQRLQLKFIVTNNIDNLDDVDCFFVFYDISSNQSFLDAKKLVQDKILIEKLPIFFIGNKSDLKSVVNKLEVDNFCKKNKLYNMVISVKNNIGISALIKKFTQLFNYGD